MRIVPHSLLHDLNYNLFSASQLEYVVKWINSVLPQLNLPFETSEEELRALLKDGSVLCSILDKLIPGSVEIVGLSFNLLLSLYVFYYNLTLFDDSRYLYVFAFLFLVVIYVRAYFLYYVSSKKTVF